MKKTRFIALVLVVAMMLVGAGYAAWTDQVFVTSTVRTGNFDVEITKATVRSGDNDAQNYAHNPAWSHYDWTHTGTVTHNANEAIVEFKDLYPGGCIQLDMTTTNKGTIPAKLKSIDVQFLGGNGALYNALQAQTSWKANITGDGTDVEKWAHVNNWANWYGIERELEQELVASLAANNIVIEPKGWLSFDSNDETDSEPGCILFRLDPNVGNEYQNQSCVFKVTFNWEQWSTTPGSDPYTEFGGDGDKQ